jgi:hypothetical protein
VLILSIVLYRLKENGSYEFDCFVQPAFTYCLVLAILLTIVYFVSYFIFIFPEYNIITGIILGLLFPFAMALIIITSPLAFLGIELPWGNTTSFNFLLTLLVCFLSAVAVSATVKLVKFIFGKIWNSKKYKDKKEKVLAAYRDKAREVDKLMTKDGDKRQDVSELKYMINNIDVVSGNDKNLPMVKSLINCIEERYAYNIVQAKQWMEKNRKDRVVREEIEAMRREIEKTNSKIDSVGSSIEENQNAILKSIRDADYSVSRDNDEIIHKLDSIKREL